MSSLTAGSVETNGICGLLLPPFLFLLFKVYPSKHTTYRLSRQTVLIVDFVSSSYLLKKSIFIDSNVICNKSFSVCVAISVFVAVVLHNLVSIFYTENTFLYSFFDEKS